MAEQINHGRRRLLWMEDYGSPETDDSLADVANQNQNQGYGDRTDNDVTARTNQGRYSGGTEGTDTGSEGAVAVGERIRERGPGEIDRGRGGAERLRRRRR